MEKFPDVLRKEASKNERTKEVLAKLDYNKTTDETWNFLYKIMESEARSIVESIFILNSRILTFEKDTRR